MSGHEHGHSDHEADPHSFDDRAATWDDEAKIERAQVVAEAISAAVALTPSLRVLEYGAGTGLVTQALQDRVGPVTLADTSEGMRAEMEKKVEAGLLPTDARVVDWDLSSGAVPNEQFDLIVTVLVLHHVVPLAPALEAFAALLAPGGHLCVVDLEAEDGSFHGEGFSGHRGFEPEELAAQLRTAGFGAVTSQRVYEMDRGDATYGVFLSVATLPQ